MTDSSSIIKVLIAEDQEIARIGLVIMLRSMSELSVVGSACNGKEAYEQCLSLKPDVVLMDLSMPIMNGIEATQLIRAELPATKVIMVTTHDRDEDVFAALAAGADGYCLKTASEGQLLAAIQTVIDGGAWLDPAIADRVLRASQPSVSAKTPPAPQVGAGLTTRELEVLKLLVDGLSNQEMAVRLVVSLETIKTHMRHIMEKLTVADRTQAAVKAVRRGLV